MPRPVSRSRRLATAARWPVGVALTSWRYMWRTTPMHRSEEPGDPERDAPPPLPVELERDELQDVGVGAGPLFHRRYSAKIRDTTWSPEQLLGRVAGEPDRVAPTELASFQKVRGPAAAMCLNDEYVVRMPAPWDGPVRVAEVTPTSFRLVTLAGHLEAGQIEFRAERDGDLLRFTIESWARNGDRVAELLYDRLRMAKEVQLHIWTSLLERVAELSGGRLTGGIEIRTRRLEYELAALRDRQLNFDPARLPELVREGGWRVDDLRQPLPPEPPGEPVAGGTWERTRELMDAYQVADPALVRATYDDDAPFEGRDMLLTLSYHGLRFHCGVRVGEVYEDDREEDGRTARIYGWKYRTLEGHFEQGEMAYEVWKWRDSGEVEFHIHAVSRPAASGPTLLRLGFRVFGRRPQLRFYRRACERMAELVAER
jgi:uncharacterized protein (UPF0548 family)